MISEIYKAITIAEMAVITFSALYILVIKRDILDPRLYVLYGIFHWLFVGQLYYVFDIAAHFEFEIYEPTSFSAEEILVGSVVVFFSTTSFLGGYSLSRLYYPRIIELSADNLSLTKRLVCGHSSRLLHVPFFLFIIAAITNLLFESGALIIPVSLVLPLGYLMPVASIFFVVALFLHFTSHVSLGLHWRMISWSLLGLIMAVSNIALIYPIITAFVLIGAKYLPKMNRGRIVSILIFSPALIFTAMIIQLAGKVYRRLQTAGVEIDFSNFLTVSSFEESLSRAIVTLDSFNIESFAVLLQSFRDFIDQGVYLWGASLLSAVPVFKLLSGDTFQSFGRALAIEALGVSSDSNTAFAVSPIAELSVNFTFLGAFIFYFSLGAFCCFIQAKYQRSKSYASVVAYIVFLIWLFLQQRGDFLNGNMYPAYVLLVTYIVARLFSKRRRNWMDVLPVHSNSYRT